MLKLEVKMNVVPPLKEEERDVRERSYSAWRHPAYRATRLPNSGNYHRVTHFVRQGLVLFGCSCLLFRRTNYSPVGDIIHESS